MTVEKISPQILVISNKYDFATDDVVFHLNRCGVSYLRLNRDQFSDFNIGLCVEPQKLYGETPEFEFEVTRESLRSIYFRAPVYLRDLHQPYISPDEQLQRSQWAAFIRGLTVFDGAFWVNHPQATYQAEIKPYQLYLAAKIGFDIPQTLITNSERFGTTLATTNQELIIKTLDTAIINMGERQAFIYTNTVEVEELVNSNISSAPVILQEALLPKLDIRVTVVRQRVFAVTIKQNGRGIDADWRTQKEGLEYDPIDLPVEIQTRCRNLMRAMSLQFGALDLVFSKGKYYFLEINPTGEWAWLADHTPFKIDEQIAAALIEAEAVLT